MTPWFAADSFFQILNFNTKETYHMVRFEKDTRYYAMRIEKDLLNDWVVVAINGRIQTKLGQIRTLAFTSYSDAFDHFCAMIQVRLKRHYHLTSYRGANTFLLQLLVYVQPTVIEDEIPKVTPPLTTPKPRSRTRSKNMVHPTPIQMGLF